MQAGMKIIDGGSNITGKPLPPFWLSSIAEPSEHSRKPQIALRRRPIGLRERLSNTLWKLHICRLEVRSLVLRIRMWRDTKRWQLDLDAGPAYQKSKTSEHLLPCERTFARIRDIQCLLASRPWATDADVLLALHAWQMGEQYAQNSHSEQMETGTLAAG
jgi:hypothetical protein